MKYPDLTKNQYHAIMHPMWRNCIEYYDVPEEFATHYDYLEKLCNDGIKNEIVTNFPFCIGVSSL